MNEADLTDRILNLARALVGFLRGGLAIVNILASVLFAGLSGSATADTAALGSLEIPMMVKDGYSKGIQRGGNSGILYYWPHYTTQCHACDVCGDCQRKYY